MGIVSVEIDNFRSFAPGAGRVPSGSGESFSPALNLIVGPNGSGKTTILNALSLAFGRGQGNSQGNMGPGFASDPKSAAEHHDRSKPLTITVGFDYGVEAQRGQLQVVHTLGEPPQRLLNTKAVPWDVDQLLILQQLHDRCFPMGWPRQIWKLAQRSFKSLPGTSPEFYAKAWQRIQSVCNEAIGSGLGNPVDLTTHCKIACPLCGNEPTRDVVGDSFVDAHGVPLLHSSDGHGHFAYMTLEIEKHEKPTTFLLEEPDVFMHASLQKGFIRYVLERCKSPGHQFFITTHSPYILDLSSRGAAKERPVHIYRVSYRDGTQVERRDAGRMWDVLQDLGHRPSDVMHPNGIVWVEGPSDVMFLEFWLAKWIAANGHDKIVRGIDYDLLPYGGANIAHIDYKLEFSQPVAEKLVNLAKVHPNSAILIDRDDGLEDRGKGKNKKDVLDAFGAARGHLTGPRCIEGYLLDDVRRHCRIPENLKDRWKKVPAAQKCIEDFGGAPFESIVDLENTDIDELLSRLYQGIQEWGGPGKGFR